MHDDYDKLSLLSDLTSVVFLVAARSTLRCRQSNGAVVLWRIVPRNLFGGANKDDRLEETLNTTFPHKGAVTCLTHTRRGAYGALGGPLLFSGATDHTIKVIRQVASRCHSWWDIAGCISEFR